MRPASIPPRRPPLPGLIGAALFVLLAGGGGVYAMVVIGRTPGAGAVASEATPNVIVFIPPPSNASTPTPAAATSGPAGLPIVPLPWDWSTPTSQATNTARAQVLIEEPAFDAIPAGSEATATPVPPTPTPTDVLVNVSTLAASPSLTPTAPATPLVIPHPNGLPDIYLPRISARARDLYQYGLTLGNNPRVFSRLGDCHSSYPGFLGAFDTPTQYRLGEYAYLREVIDHYAGSFSHPSQTAYSGLHMGSFFSPLWADPQTCAGGENVMECEYRLRRPSLIFINIGTLNKESPDEQYESFVRPIVEFWLQRGVLPILNTKADNIEGDGRFNAVMRRLAAEYDIPLWDFWIASQSLPNQGLAEDQVHLSEGKPYFDDANEMRAGWTLRNLTGLQALDIVRRELKK